MNMYNFPFDVQTCEIVFGSLRHGIDEFYLRSIFGEHTSMLNIADHFPNNEWLIVDYGMRLVDVQRHGKTFQEIRGFIKVKRFSGFYFQFIIIPTLTLATLILIIFFIPPERPDRTTLGKTQFNCVRRARACSLVCDGVCLEVCLCTCVYVYLYVCVIICVHVSACRHTCMYLYT